MSFINDFINGFKEYMTQTWKNRPSTETPISAERLNHIESGIKSISDAIKNMASAIMKDMADLTIGASDWNAAEGEPGYVKNRTHWMEFVSKEEVILEETSVSFKNEMSSLYGLGSDKVIAGKPYIVYWNGTAYECTAFYADQSVFLGNGILSGVGTDTGEPFCMEMLAATSAFVMKSNSNAETIKIKVETPEVVKYHTLDPNFIPPGISGGITSWNDLTDKPFYTESGIVELLPETTAITELPETPNENELYLDLSDGAFLLYTGVIPLTVGETYIVKFNGVEYECVAQVSPESSATLVLGDLSGLTGGTSTGEPFVLIFMPESVESVGIQGVINDGSTSVTLGITYDGSYVKQIESKYVPYPEYDYFDLTGLGAPTAGGVYNQDTLAQNFYNYVKEHGKARVKVLANFDSVDFGEYDRELTFGHYLVDSQDYYETTVLLRISQSNCLGFQILTCIFNEVPTVSIMKASVTG